MPKKPQVNPMTVFLAGVLAWIIPGAGHVYLNRTVRGIILCVCINGMFWSGLAMGGAFTIDPIRERWWFAAQMVAGASGLAGWYNQEVRRQQAIREYNQKGDHARMDDLPPPPTDRRRANWLNAYSSALAAKGWELTYPAETVSRAFTGIAGMLNVICIFDAVMLAAIGAYGEPPRQAPPESPPARPRRPKEAAA